MTITVSGNTYNYRDILRNMGGTFTDEKVWKFTDTLGPAERTYLKKLIGCVVTDDAKAEPAEDFMARVAQKTERRGRTAIYGDDTTYFNHFAERDPLAFFGFSSVSALLDYIDAIPSAVKNDKRRNDAWITDAERRQFTKTNSMEHAFQLAKDGWKEGADKAAQIAEIISAEHATVSGGR